MSSEAPGSPEAWNLARLVPTRLGRCLLVIGCCYLPLVFLGYGTDIDVFGVRQSGAAIRSAHYRLSRPPGAPVHEMVVSLLDRVGPVATNLASLALALVLLACLARLLGHHGDRQGILAVAVVAANPFFIIAATSLVDHVWAITLLLLGLEALRNGRKVVGGLAWALAIGVRLATVAPIFVLCLVLALEWRHNRPALRQLVVAAVLAATFGALCYLPAWVHFGSFAFLHVHESSFGGFASNGGRWALKNMLVLGFPAAVVAAVVVVRRLPRLDSGSHHLAVAAAAVLLAYEATYVRYPWKLGHLVPVVVLLALSLGALRAFTGRVAVALVVLQLLWGVVALRTVVPDVPGAAQGARVAPKIVVGPLINDIRCRFRSLRSGEDGDTYGQAVADWTCANSWWTERPEVAPSINGRSESVGRSG